MKYIHELKNKGENHFAQKRHLEERVAILESVNRQLESAKGHTAELVRSAMSDYRLIKEECDAVRAELEYSQVEAARLREVERLAREYKRVVLERRRHEALGMTAGNDQVRELRWALRLEELTDAKRAAGEALFTALGDEAE